MAKPPRPAPGKRSPDWEATLRRIGDILSPIAQILVIIGVFVGGYQYFQQLHATRVEKTLELVTEWNTEGAWEAYQRIDEAIRPEFAKSRTAIEAEPSGSSGRSMLYANIGDRIAANPERDIAGDLDRVFSFFDRAAVCIENQICDHAVLIDFLGAECESFWLYFQRYAQQRRDAGYLNYGIWTQKLATGDIAGGLFGFL